jgi:uncharacterized SAM-binding protein YcdF (DUF218 family)
MSCDTESGRDGMVRTTNRKKRLLVAFGVPIVLATIFHAYPLRLMGNFLVCRQEPRKADMIVVLNGRDTERSLEAVDLYNEDRANLIVMARMPEQPGNEEFRRRVGESFNRTPFFERAIEAMGVPKGAFQYIGDGVTSTFDEAVAARDFALERGFRSMLVVTSKWHSRRAYLTFRSAVGETGLRIAVEPSPYDAFDPDGWWRNEDNAELVFREYVRLAYYLITLRLSPAYLFS